MFLTLCALPALLVCMRALHAGVPGSGCQLCKGCELCTAGTFSPGDTLDPCLPCRFGFSSSPGATSESRCQKVANPCPAGSQAPANATTSQDCMCKPGYGTVADVVVPGESICTQVRLLLPASLPCPSLPCLLADASSTCTLLLPCTVPREHILSWWLP
jgi:hypothetical protein